MRGKFALIALAIAFVGLLATRTDAALGYPWETCGEISYSPELALSEKGIKLDGYFQQGIDWFRLGDTKWIADTFAGLRFTESDHADEWWNNKVGLWTGVQMVNRDISPTQQGWGIGSFGVRGEFYTFNAGRHENEMRAVVFGKWTFGGNWKRQ